MDRFLPAAAGLALGCACAVHAAEVSVRLHVQDSPLAGFRYYDGREAWPGMKTGDRLALRREPGNPHDANAIRIEWQGRMIGYVPRSENQDLARQLDHGAPLEARITGLAAQRNGRHRMSYVVYVPLEGK